jgi:flagellar assembly factor FliW
MEIDTRFGTQDVDPEDILTFPNGIPGLEGLSRFKLFHEEGKASVFWLQSVEDPSVQLAVAEPSHFRIYYELALTDDEIAQLDLADPNDVALLVTLSKPSEDQGVHANFMGPIILNTRSRVGLQKVLVNVEGGVVVRAE